MTPEQQNRINQLLAHAEKSRSVTEPVIEESSLSLDRIVSVEETKTLEKIQEIEKQYGGLQSNIPINSEYWILKNLYQSLRS